MLNFPWRRLGGLVVAGLLMLGGLPAFAAKPVTTAVPRKPSERTYEAAAQALGAKFWGDRFGSARRNHVTLRLDRTHTSLVITVPAGIPSAAASTRLQDLADRLGWGDASLYQWVESGTQVFMLRRRTAQGVRWSGWAQGQIILNATLIADWVRTLNVAPMAIAVRTISPDLATTTPAATVRGTYDEDTFLFYEGLAAPLQLHFRLPGRLIAAYLGALLLWMLFPIIAGVALRRYASNQLRLASEEQTTRFERWKRPLTWVTLGGMLLTLGALERERLDFIVPSLGSNSAPFVLVPLWFWTAAAAGWGWSRGGGERTPLAAGDRSSNAIAIIVAFAFGMAFMPSVQNGGAGLPLQAVGLVVGGLLVLFGLWVLVAPLPAAMKPLNQARTHVPMIGDDPESLRRALAEATAQMREPIRTLPEQVNVGIAARFWSFTEAMHGLEPDQQAALVVAAQLHAARIAHPPARTLLTQRLPVSGMLIAGGLIAAAMPRTNLAGAMALGMVAVALLFGVGLLVRLPQARMERSEREADLKVARAMEEPQRLVEALRRLEAATESSTGEIGFSLSASFGRRRRNLERLLVVALFCLGLGAAPPAYAQYPQSPSEEPNPPAMEDYRDAAAAAGAEFWSDPAARPKTVQAAVWVGSDYTSLTLVIPTAVPADRLSTWLEDTASELSWEDTDLQFHVAKDRCYVGLIGTSRRKLQRLGLNRRLELDLPRLAARTRMLSAAPVTLVVRSPGEEVETRPGAASTPIARGAHGGETYLFYPPASAPAAPVTVDYGLPARWLTAVTSTLLLWVLLPLGAAFALRRHLERVMGDRPAELARTYATRASFIRLVAVAGSFGTLWLLGMGRLDFFHPGLGVLWPILLVIPVWSAAALGCRAVRPAVPEAQMLGRRQDLGLMILRHLALLAIGPGSVLLFLFAPNWRGGGFSRGVWLPGLALTTFSLYLLVNVALQNFRAARIPPSPELPQVDGSPESIRTALAAAMQFLEANPQHVIPLPKELKGTAVEQRFLRLQEKVLELDADQRAALRVSQAVVLRDARVKNPWVHRVVLLSLVILGAGGIALMVGRHTPGSALGVTLGSVFTFALLQRLVRRKLLRPVISAQADADLQVAREMEQPERLLAALRALEEFAAKDPVLSDPRFRLEEFAHRREHLEAALLRGLDASS